MMILNIINLVLWELIGLINLTADEDKVSKYDYGITWLVLMLHLFSQCLGN